jgi:hypothetical protein
MEPVMAMNRIQIQPGLSLNELIKRYGTETQCEEPLEKMRWPSVFQYRQKAGILVAYG